MTARIKQFALPIHLTVLDRTNETMEQSSLKYLSVQNGYVDSLSTLKFHTLNEGGHNETR
jgi:hypothetical protein